MKPIVPSHQVYNTGEGLLNKPVFKYNLGGTIKSTKCISESLKSFAKDNKGDSRDTLDYARPGCL